VAIWVSGRGVLCYLALVKYPALLALLAIAACDRGHAETRPPGDARAAEQAEFEKQRHPDAVLATLGLRPGEVVADIGAGTGLFTVLLARAVSPGGRVVATDIDQTVLDLLAARVHEAGLDGVVETRKVPADDPDLEASTYDVIFLSEVDHYFEDPAAWLKKALPALKPGGTIAITNRSFHRDPAIAAASAAGLRLQRENDDVPGQYTAIFERAP
jgi:predicted O-methyltransferase YrrM